MHTFHVVALAALALIGFGVSEVIGFEVTGK